jgi:AAA+ superfamily predicted ATPase
MSKLFSKHAIFLRNLEGLIANSPLLLIDRERASSRESFDFPEDFFSEIPLLSTASLEEQNLFLIALAPHISPHFFDQTIQSALPNSGDFPQIGGTRGKNFRGFLPTGETALFLLAGDDLEKRFEVQELFGSEHFFAKKKILWLETVPPGEPLMSGRIILSPDYVELFTTGKVSPPHFSTEFPAKKIETNLTWEDLILPAELRQQIQELETWIKHNDTLLHDWGMAKRLKPGYRVLFYGPPGTGKTMTATILGKYTGREVYRVDLSTVVSKFIGETEKNLASLFDKAEDKNWILFFDEADSLFGKRTNVRDAHDKYANQEVSYLLQRVEEFNGLVILASNFKSNIDEAFMRRFNAVVKFPMPERPEREEIWRRCIPTQLINAKNGLSENIPQLASRFEISGGHIINVVQYASLKCLANGDRSLPFQYVLDGIKREFEKEGRIFSE